MRGKRSEEREVRGAADRDDLSIGSDADLERV